MTPLSLLAFHTNTDVKVYYIGPRPYLTRLCFIDRLALENVSEVTIVGFLNFKMIIIE